MVGWQKGELMRPNRHKKSRLLPTQNREVTNGSNKRIAFKGLFR